MNPAYPDLLPVMSDEEYHNLKADIERSGLQIPIEIDAETREILDGWHRYKACRELGITLSAGQMRERRFSSEEERKWFCISLNLNRRHLSQSQKAAFIVEYKLGPEREKAKERQRLNGRQSWGKKSNPPILGDSIPRHGAATEILAQTF
jgi:ParB-like chromosome segregation protein Spo0J